MKVDLFASPDFQSNGIDMKCFGVGWTSLTM